MYEGEREVGGGEREREGREKWEQKDREGRGERLISTDLIKGS